MPVLYHYELGADCCSCASVLWRSCTSKQVGVPHASVGCTNGWVQVIEMPSQADSQLQIGDILMEVSIMERFSECEGVCRLLDYGVTCDGFHMVMPLYKCSLAEWRSALPHDLRSCLDMQRLFINIFRKACTPFLLLIPCTYMAQFSHVVKAFAICLSGVFLSVLRQCASNTAQPMCAGRKWPEFSSQ